MIEQISFLAQSQDVVPAVENMLYQASREPGVPVERRSEPRYPYCKMICLVPTDRHSLEKVGDPVWVIGKELSTGGLGFFHQQPIPHRDLLMQVDPAAEDLWLLMRIRWCRFLRPGWYESGGQFLRTAPGNPLTREEPDPVDDSLTF